MAEVFGIITAACAALQQSISLFNTIKEVLDSIEGVPEIIAKNTRILNEDKDLLDLIKAEKALQTIGVGTAAERVKNGALRLNQFLERMQKRHNDGKVKRLVRAFVEGPEANERNVEGIMKELVDAKIGLVANLLVVNVGLTWGVGNILQVNTAELQRLNEAVQEKLHDGTKSLHLTERVKGRPVNGMGCVELNADDIKYLREHAPAVDVSTSPTLSQSFRAKKVIESNLVTDDAWMQNVPVSELDGWQDCDVFITNNTADGHGVMQNYPLPQEVLLKMFQTKYGPTDGSNSNKRRRSEGRSRSSHSKHSHNRDRDRDRRSHSPSKAKRGRK
ncbi:hypothetical protein F5Y10DRAFT_248449 [Nemania abortiva]|nr:hypothetical protein F5Y10DRAFT_248449 [Nemania abortiva]